MMTGAKRFCICASDLPAVQQVLSLWLELKSPCEIAGYWVFYWEEKLDSLVFSDHEGKKIKAQRGNLPQFT